MRNKRVIFVDDEEFTARLTCEALRDPGGGVLEMHSDEDTHYATDAREPLFALVTDINLTDINLGHGHGDFGPTAPPRGAGASARCPGVSIGRLEGASVVLPSGKRRDRPGRVEGALASIHESSTSAVLAADSPGLCILHVDDHPMNRRLVAEVLRALGHRSFEAACGAEALEQLQIQVFDLVLMDINMPGMSGIEVTRRLRSLRGARRDTPVIALTSEVEYNTADYVALGFDGYVAKPFAIQILAQAIETRGRRRRKVEKEHPTELLAG